MTPDVKSPDVKSLGKDFFSENGRISEIDSINFEYRESQERMAGIVSDALFNGEHVVIEAPTGVGKSFAYLIPAIYYSKIEDKRVVIATDTNTLLNQLESKDVAAIVDLLKRVDPVLFAKGIKVVSIRGKANYLCLKRMQDFFANSPKYAGLSEKDKAKLAKELDNLRMFSRFASRSEIKKGSKLINEFWPDVCMSEIQSCSQGACGLKQSECKYYTSLVRSVSGADIILTNHALLLSDVLLRCENETGRNEEEVWDKETYVLPPFRNLIIDEAHNLCKNCESSLSETFSFRSVRQILQALTRKGDDYFVRLSRASAVDFTLDQAAESLEKAERLLKDLNVFSNSFAMSVQDKLGDSFNPKYGEIDLSDGFLSDDCRCAAEGYAASLKDFVSSFHPKPSNDNEDELFQIDMMIRDIVSQSEVISIILEKRTTDSEPPIPYSCVATAQLPSDRSGSLFDSQMLAGDIIFEINAVPVFAGKVLGSMLYSKMNGLVFTSATLNANDDFRFFKSFSGLDADEAVKCLSMPAVFDYENNMVEVAMEGIDTSSAKNQAEIEKAANFIAKAINIANGRTLCLFSSYDALKKSSDYILENDLLDDGLELLCQSRKSISSELMREFRENEKASLFATSSFWEGVDFPGDTLQLLVIHKIPFRAPCVLSNRQDILLKKNGRGSTFMSIDLPQSIIRMKQGIGRLLRSKTDKGVAVFLDTRLVDGKPYGKRILNSLYLGNTIVADAENALEHIRKFFEGV